MVTDVAPTELIDRDIRRAQTLPARYYREPQYFEEAREKIFAKSWQFIGDTERLTVPGQIIPLTLLSGYLDEPLIMTRDSDDRLNLLSNVCTHRGSLLVEGECHQQSMRCRYHGRRFSLCGDMISTPGFENAENFPSKQDNLAKVPFGTWANWAFASVDPAYDLDEAIGPMKQRVGWMPLKDFRYEPRLSCDYIAKANWALYCENYLEGFHIPYVHPSLAPYLDPKEYTTETHAYSSVQIGIAANPADAFDIPASAPDHGKKIAAYYYWVWPNMMFNVYPWGLSANVVVPLAADRTRIQYITYIWDETKLGTGAGANTDKVEREDENIIELVQKGVRSRFYDRGRYSPDWETGPHHFHQLLTKALP